MFFMILLGWLAPANFTAAVAAPVDGSTQHQQSAFEPASSAASPKDCRAPAAQMADETGDGPRARRLDELPPGRLEYAVFREVGGCPIPAVVHEGVPAFPGTVEDKNR